MSDAIPHPERGYTYDVNAPVTSAFRNGGKSLTIAFGVIIALASASAALLIYEWLQPDPYDPFGEYPLQQVIAPTVPHDVSLVAGQVQLIEYPTVSISDGETNVTGQKCMDSNLDGPVPVAGELVWQGVAPKSGIAYEQSGQDADPGRAPGCTPFDFVNPIPPEVIAQAEAHFARLIEDGQEPVWVVNINGREWPLDDDGQRVDPSVTQTWTTVNFALVP